MNDKKSVADYYLQLIDERRLQLVNNPEHAEWRYRTLIKHITAQRHLKDFAPNACWDDVSQEWLQGMERHLVDKGYSNSYVKRLLRDVKTFLNWAYHTGLYSNASFREFHAKYRDETGKMISGNKFALSLEELKLLQELDLQKRRKLQRTRDMFLFCCYTGLRFSDAMKLRWSDIGDSCIKIVTQKTNQLIEIPITKQMKLILERYERKDSSDRVFPQTTNMSYNSQLQEVGRIAGLDEDWIKVRQCGNTVSIVRMKKYQCLSSHVARRTFSTIALQQGMPMEVIMSITGHTTVKMLQGYMKINQGMKRRYMERFAIDSDLESLAHQIMQLTEEKMAQLFTMIFSYRRA